MTSRPYELLVRFAPDGSVGGASIRTITTVNGRDYEGDPEPLSGAEDPAFKKFADDFAAAAASERDQLRLELETTRVELEKTQSLLTGSQAEGVRLTADLETARAELVAARAELDEVRGDLQKSKIEAVQLAAEAEGLRSQLAALEDQVTPDSPRQVPPYTFLSLLKPEEIFGLQTSLDPTVVIARAKLQTIITFVDLDNPETIWLVQYMESIGLVGPGRAEEILAGTPFQV